VAICGGKAIYEALVTKSIDFADRPLLYFDSLTNPNVKGYADAYTIVLKCSSCDNFSDIDFCYIYLYLISAPQRFRRRICESTTYCVTFFWSHTRDQKKVTQ